MGAQNGANCCDTWEGAEHACSMERVFVCYSHRGAVDVSCVAKRLWVSQNVQPVGPKPLTAYPLDGLVHSLSD